ncbi:MAG: hypothetical protein IPH50_02930 [Rhodanobacteraceae bacterium]|nr:hypothetical protein [Rhodanobacteraceae bacterium]
MALPRPLCATSRTIRAWEDVRFVGKTAGDFSPVRIGFDLTTRFPAGQNQIARTQIDFNGDGTFDVDTVSPPATIESDYAVAGVYLARARVTFDDGSMVTVPVEREATFRIQTHLLAYTREVVCKLYYDMKHRLQANNIMSALNTVAASKRRVPVDLEFTWRQSAHRCR